MSEPDVTTEVTRDTASATAVIPASAETIFEFIRRPANHGALSGDESVKATTAGPERLSAGDGFGMQMRIGAPYRVSSRVVEFEENRLIAWCHFSGHRWRWRLEPVDAGHTRVTETFDLSTARLPIALRLMGYPKRHRGNVATSVRNLARLVT